MNEEISHKIKSELKEDLEEISQHGDAMIIFFDEYLQRRLNMVLDKIKTKLKNATIGSRPIGGFIIFLNKEISIHNGDNTSRKIFYKKYFLYYLEVYADLRNDLLIPALSQLENGLSGRCKDGKYNFFNEWFSEYTLQKNSEIVGLKKKFGHDMERDLELKIQVSKFFLEIKKDFIGRHLSRVKNDPMGEVHFTARVLLNHILMESLGIPGYYSPLDFPGYALGPVIKNKYAMFKPEELMKRYFEGGEVEFLEPVHKNKIYGLTIPRIISLFKASIAKLDGPPEEHDSLTPIKQEEIDESLPETINT